MNDRQQQVLSAILTQPDATLQEIGDQIGVTRERVRQIYEKLRSGGLVVDRKALRQDAIGKQREGQISEREEKKRTWRKMIFIGTRLRLRFMAHIDHRGMVNDYHMPGGEAICQFRGCARPVCARGFCRSHYTRLRATGSLWVRRSSRYICKEHGCYIPVYARDLCQNHYRAFMKKRDNKELLNANNTSGYRGVSRPYDYSGWVANIRSPEGRQKYLGSYKSAEMAARAYDTAARKYFGTAAKLNFPNENIEVVKPSLDKEHPNVHWNQQQKRYHVRISRHGKRIYVGSFVNLVDAIAARDKALQENGA